MKGCTFFSAGLLFWLPQDGAMLMSAQQQTTACAAWSVPLVNGCERRGRRTPLLSEKDSRSGTEGQQYWTKVTDVEEQEEQVLQEHCKRKGTVPRMIEYS